MWDAEKITTKTYLVFEINNYCWNLLSLSISDSQTLKMIGTETYFIMKKSLMPMTVSNIKHIKHIENRWTLFKAENIQKLGLCMTRDVRAGFTNYEKYIREKKSIF